MELVQDRLSAALGLAHRLLMDDMPADALLRELAEMFQADDVGLSDAVPGGRTFRVRSDGEETALPWSNDVQVILQVLESPTPVTLADGDRRRLCVPVGTDRVLWLENPSALERGESEALLILGQVLDRQRMLSEPCGLRVGAQERLEDAVLVARKMAHVYSNVLTSILGFVEMSLSQVPAASTLKRYLEIAFRGAQQGVDLTQRLRLLGCRASASAVGASLLSVLGRQINKRSVPGRIVEEVLDIPGELPGAALSNEQLTAILESLLDNAHDALERGGRVVVAVRVRVPDEDERRSAWGRLGPGPFLCLDVVDNGPGLGSEARARIFRQPFFTTKPRRHGLGLTIVHSILSSHQGGLCLLDTPGGGLTVRVFLPVVSTSLPGDPAERSRP